MPDSTTRVPTRPTAVRVARVYADYACQSSLACCSTPIRAPLVEGDLERIDGCLRRGGDEEATALADALPGEVEGFEVGGFAVLTQDGEGRCTMLGPTRLCRLQERGGLEALPSPCRNFPRSVIALGDGRWEVAFSMRCPTAAGMLARAPGEFVVEERAGAGWERYPAIRRCVEPMAVLDREVDYDGVDALRAGWWEVFRGATSGGAVIDALGALYEDPATPRPAPAVPVAVLGLGLSGGKILEVQRAVEALPVRGDVYLRFRWHIWARLQDAYDLDRLAALADASPAHVAAHACSELHWAGVHDPRPFEAAAWSTVERVVGALRVYHALTGVYPRPAEVTWGDAFSAASHLDVKWQTAPGG